MISYEKISHESEAARIAYERAATIPQPQQHEGIAIGRVRSGPTELLKVFGIDYAKEKFYFRQPAMAGDKHNGLYFVIPTVDQDSPKKAWDVRVFYIGDGARILKLAYWFRQGDPETPGAMAGVAMHLRDPDGIPVLMITEDVDGKALFPAVVFELNPVVGA